MTDETKEKILQANKVLLTAAHDIANEKMSRPEMYRKAKDALDKVDEIYKDDKLTK